MFNPLIPTEDVRAKLEQARERLGQPNRSDSNYEIRAYRVAFYEWLLGVAERRDAAPQPRPEGCECGGAGGVNAEYSYKRLKETGHYVFELYCRCPEGRAAFERDLPLKRAENHARHEQLADLFLDDLPVKYRGYTLASYPQQTAAQRKVVERINGWLDEDHQDDIQHPWLFLYGPYGTGKSGLAMATAYQAIHDCMVDAATFVAVPSLLDRLRSTYRKGSDESEGDVMDVYREAELLILDDLGSERATDWATERLFVLLNDRYESQSRTIVTSNLGPDELGAHIGERSMWRLAELSLAVPLKDCPNLRIKKPKAQEKAAA